MDKKKNNAIHFLVNALKNYVLIYLTIALATYLSSFSVLAIVMPIYTAHYVLIAIYFVTLIEKKILKHWLHVVMISLLFIGYFWLFGSLYSDFCLLPEALIISTTYALIVKFWIKTKVLRNA